MTERTVLVIEDDVAVRRGMVAALRHAGFAVEEAGDGVEGTRGATAGRVDLVLLDLVLPGRDGLDVLEKIRAVDPALPVIVVTARGAEDDRVRGLELGADDYVVKPFGARELVARVEAVLRRSPGRPDGVPSSFTLGRGQVDLDGSRVGFPRTDSDEDGGEDSTELSKLECDLLRYLKRSAGRVVSRDELLARVWGVKPHRTVTRSVDMAIARLRKKLRDGEDGRPPALATVRGEGYRLDP
jgi:DNA-binding response OmpR family regulator